MTRKRTAEYEHIDSYFTTDELSKDISQNPKIAGTVRSIEAKKNSCEGYIVGCIYKSPEVLDSTDIQMKDFTGNFWRVCFCMFVDMYTLNYNINENNIESYLAEHPNMKAVFEERNGYQQMESIKDAVVLSDFQTYAKRLVKWSTLIKLVESGFPITERMLSETSDISVDDMYTRYLSILDSVFTNSDAEIASEYDAADNIEQLNDELDRGVEKGVNLGMYGTSNIINTVMSGINVRGHIYGLGALSGVGKSFLTIEYFLPIALGLNNKDPKSHEDDESWVYTDQINYVAANENFLMDPDSIISTLEGRDVDKNKQVLVNAQEKGPTKLKHDKICFFVNEEDHKKVQREIEVWVINNIILNDNDVRFNKRRLLQGGFSDEERDVLNKAENFIKNNLSNKLKIVPLEKYSASTVIKLMRKLHRKGYGVFVLDTLKESYDQYGVETWKSMERDLRSMYDVIKSTALNACLFVTYQLSKQAMKSRYLTNGDIGQAKNIIDVMSANIMIRRPYSDEYESGKNKIEVTSSIPDIISDPSYNSVEAETKTCLDPEKKYFILFVAKNRFGESNGRQIVAEINQSYNTYREIGTCDIPMDFN